MKVLPISLINLDQTPVVVVGGGKVAERKIRTLLAVDAQVWVVSPQLTPTLQAWAVEKRLRWVPRPYRSGDLEGARLAFAATNDRSVNHAVAKEAGERGVLVNVADCPAEGGFHMPAVHHALEVLVAVSSYSGRPRVAQQVRNRIATLLASPVPSSDRPAGDPSDTEPSNR